MTNTNEIWSQTLIKTHVQTLKIHKLSPGRPQSPLIKEDHTPLVLSPTRAFGTRRFPPPDHFSIHGDDPDFQPLTLGWFETQRNL